MLYFVVSRNNFDKAAKKTLKILFVKYWLSSPYRYSGCTQKLRADIDQGRCKFSGSEARVEELKI